MSFFSNLYTKEGPGVYADDPKKGPAGQFFSILGRKFWKIVTVNLMYVLFSAPVLVLSVLISPMLLQFLFPGFTYDKILLYIQKSDVAASLVEGITPEMFTNTFLVFLYILAAVFFVAMSLIVLGPVHAGATYVLRNYSREEHAFLWSDFWEHAKKNLVQSLISGAISLVVTVALIISLGVYRSIIPNQLFRLVITGFLLLIFAVFSVMQMYIYPMMVTFKLSLKNIYKNAFLFFTLKLFPNIGILLISLVLNLVIPLVLILFLQVLGFYIMLVYFLFIGFGLQLLITNFFVYRQLDRFMIQRMNEEVLAGENVAEISEDAKVSEGITEGSNPPE
ncbi:MAG TPA: DUF624 domain-containing protein [Clostridia bacterium]